jgi:hypothetical protein
MFIATALLYPCVLAALCAGAGLLVDCLSGRFLPGALLLTVGAAALIALSQLSTYAYPLAPATPYLIAAVAAAGLVVGWGRVRGLARRCQEQPWLLLASVLAYALALAPVLLAGRTTLSSYMALSDSAVHLIGADFLMRHGQHYVHLDLHNSYGQFINDYYNTSYPSGADTLFGGSSFLLGLPLIWAFQPFNAFMLAAAVGPAWLLAQRMRLQGPWAALAALTAVVPALVYAYELFGSVKEITALSMILTLGALAVTHRSWLLAGGARVIPFALVSAGGVSALGVAFGAWALAAAAVLAVALATELVDQRRQAGEARRQRERDARAVGNGRGVAVARNRQATALPICAGALVALIAAWPTWSDLSGSLNVASEIASTTNSGNLHNPLRAEQVLGVWLNGSYKLAPIGSALVFTHILIPITLLAAALGAIHVLRIRAYALASWIVLMLLAWIAITHWVSTWGSAKTLMLTSPVVVLLAWGGVGALRSARHRGISLAAATLLALALTGGVVVSDAMQYRASNLAPTARYEELASLNSRFAGKGPALFTDFDEYSMYELRDLDIGGPDFVYPPAALAAAAGGYGQPVDLDRIKPAALLAYPLIITRRDPSASRPPAAYLLVWQGAYYQVWKRRPRAAAAAEHVSLAGSPAAQCVAIERVAHSNAARGVAGLVAAQAVTLVKIPLRRSAHPTSWGHQRQALVMGRPGTLRARFTVPAAGRWEVWVQGDIMPTVQLRVDGHELASIAGQLSGNSLVSNTIPPIPVQLSAGVHSLALTRTSAGIGPGELGSAVLNAIFLTPASAQSAPTLRAVSALQWQSLCGRSYQWIEVVGT